MTRMIPGTDALVEGRFAFNKTRPLLNADAIGKARGGRGVVLVEYEYWGCANDPAVNCILDEMFWISLGGIAAMLVFLIIYLVRRQPEGGA